MVPPDGVRRRVGGPAGSTDRSARRRARDAVRGRAPRRGVALTPMASRPVRPRGSTTRPTGPPGGAHRSGRGEGLCRAIADQAGLGADAVLAGELDLVHLAALVCDADLVVCGDTGVAHLASAYRTPSVVLFGPTPPRWWGPPSDGPHTVLWSGRTGDPHADTADPGLLDISVSDVLTAVRDRL